MNQRNKMSRRNDPPTAVEAGEEVFRTLNHRQQAVYDAMTEKYPGGVTAGTLEKLGRFSSWKPSTARKRISEMKAMGIVVETGRRFEGSAVYRALSLSEYLQSITPTRQMKLDY